MSRNISGDGDSTGGVRCSSCGETMAALDFNVHDCPFSPGPPRVGESFAEYKARANKFAEIKRLLGMLGISTADDLGSLPEAVRDIGFEHAGVHIMDPTLSDCGRWGVDPVETYGEEKVHRWLSAARAIARGAE